MEDNTKHIRVYEKDWQEFMLYVSRLQARDLKTFSFAEAFHEVAEKFIKPENEKMRKG